MIELKGEITEGYEEDRWYAAIFEGSIELCVKNFDGTVCEHRIILDVDGTSALDKMIGEIYRGRLNEINKEEKRMDTFKVDPDKISDEDLERLKEMMDRTPPQPICSGLWNDDSLTEEEKEMDKEAKEREKYKYGMMRGMDHSIRCIAQEMMECFNPNTAMINILTGIDELYKVYARRSKIPERVRNDVTYGLEHIIETIRMNNRDQKEEEE